ncbi:hypothetical protein D3C87_1933770 [compost metagenome]
MSRPSIAEEIVIAGVIMPSARSVAAPIIAGKINHGALLRTNENRDRIPPSPLLSAWSVISTYFTVVCKVTVQNTHDNPPRTRSLSMTPLFIMALKT